MFFGQRAARFKGTRAPKRGRVCIRNGEPVDIGSEVADGLARKIVGSEARLTVQTDETGRLVGSGTIGGQDIGEIAISSGFAVTKIGDYRYAAQEREARNNRPGLWSCSSSPKAENSDTAAVAPAPRPLPPPMGVKPSLAPKTTTPSSICRPTRHCLLNLPSPRMILRWFLTMSAALRAFHGNRARHSGDFWRAAVSARKVTIPMDLTDVLQNFAEISNEDDRFRYGY